MKIKSLRTLATALGAVCFLTIATFAADANGTWTWTAPGRNGNPGRPTKATLVAKDGALTGTVAGRQGDTPITDASIKDDGTIAFSVTRSFGGNSMTMKYTGKVDGDTITGSFVRPGMDGGDPVTADWKATRVTGDAAAPAPAPAQ
jgi:hypothetical protein